MTPLPGRLIVFMVFSALAGAFSLYRGPTSDGEPRLVWTICGALVFIGVLVVLIGWRHQSKRR